MAATVRDLATNDVLFTMESCASFGEFFATSEVLQHLEGPLATHQAGVCKEELEIDEAEFNALFNGKIALFIDPSDKWCNSDFFLQFQAYDALVQAGALGVVFMDNKPDITPGVWYGTYLTETAALSLSAEQIARPRIPWIHCSATGDQAGLMTDFIQTFDDPLKVAESFPSGIAFNGTTSPNEWDAMFTSIPYRIVFQGIVPFYYFALFALAMLFIYERIRIDLRRNAGIKKMMNVPVLALCIEGLTVLAIALFFAIDAMWSNYTSPMANARSVFITLLLMASMSSSLLVGLSFSDFKNNTKKLQAAHKTVIQKYRTLLIAGSAVFVVVEVLGGILRRIGNLLTLINMAAIVVSTIVSIWFMFEARSFTKLLTALTSTDDASQTQRQSGLKKIIRHTTRWINITTFGLVVGILMGVLATFNPSLIWTTDSFFAYWFILAYFRGLYSLGKIMLLRRQDAGRGNNKSSKTMTTTNHSNWTQQQNSRTRAGSSFGGGSQSQGTFTPKLGLGYSPSPSKQHRINGELIPEPAI